MLSDSSIRYQVSIKGGVEEGTGRAIALPEHFHLWQRLGRDVEGRAGGFGREAISSEPPAKNILGGAHTASHARLEWNETGCRVQRRGGGSRLGEQARSRNNK